MKFLPKMAVLAGVVLLALATLLGANAEAASRVTKSQVVAWCQANGWTCTPPEAPPVTPTNSSTFTAYVTGYTWWDNDPPGSAAIAYPVLHKQAAGSGTYADPITAAVREGAYKPGTRFYLPYLQKYFIVEDQCAGCNKPGWIDIWLDGRQMTASKADACASRITGNKPATLNPPADLAVKSGPIC